ncbi:glycosyltransferase [Paenibacillus thermotolerans]|uniref:glycosyltransferase n=1 Tax=Paenibacillus thermotolerans TaxID=3027807 RepID=UPI002367FD5F|nr:MULTISPECIES: glycosyltransferase [unclassified Paenibacillus]
MKIVHAPLEIAGQVGIICDFLKKSGIHATGYNYFPNYLKYRKVINTDTFELAKIFDMAVREYDIFHFHNSYTFLEDKRDIPMIVKAGKKIVMHHRGNDVRSRVRAAKGKGYVNPYVNANCSFPEETIDSNLRLFAKYVNAAIVQDYELHGYVADYYREQGKPVYVLPRLIDTKSIQPVYKTERSKEGPLVVHAPTQREFKGTEHVLKTIEKLQAEAPFRFRLVEGLNHSEAIRLYQEADIVIDQILCGMYGNLSVEAMALGKPVVCYIRPDLLKHYPNLPIVSANPDTLYETLRKLLKHRQLRVEIGQKGRLYVERNHSAEHVIGKLIDIYKKL